VAISDSPPQVAAARALDVADVPGTPNVGPLFLPLSWSHAVQTCGLASVIAVVLMCLGLHPLVAVLGAGFLSVTLYRQRAPGTAIKAATGARLGALGGLLFFGLSVVVAAVAMAVSNKRTEVRRQLLEAVQQNPLHYPAAQIQQVLDFVNSPAGFAFMIGLALVLMLVVSVLLGTIGGAFAGTVFGRQRRP
jgi:CDP-diglyceride synthetase